MPHQRAQREGALPGALHYEGLRRGILFFAALLSLILSGVVAVRYARPEPGFAETRVVKPEHFDCASGHRSFRYAAQRPIIHSEEAHSPGWTASPATFFEDIRCSL
jgi:hypothetical protein